jgi:integrase
MLFDKRVTEANGGVALPNWTLHDLRRTARTLMARAKVRPDVAERVVGHVIRGVEGVYDRYTYEEDKRAALEALSRLIASILNPAMDNVVELAAAR